MGPTPGCYGCKCLVRGDKEHEPHNADCRARVIEWFKRQESPNIQAGLASAQLRLEGTSRAFESQDQGSESQAKRPKLNAPPPPGAKVEDAKDEW
eukprot:5293110-Pyramimonas_sp.AAC.1